MMMVRLLFPALFLIVVIVAPHSTRGQDDPTPAPEPAEADDDDDERADPDADDSDDSDEAAEDEHPGVAGLKKVLDAVVFEDVRLRDFAMAMAAEYRFNVVIYATIPDQTLSLNLRQVPVGLALAAAARAGGCEVAIDSGIAFIWPTRVVKPTMTKQIHRIPENSGEPDELGEQISELAGTDGIVLVGPNGRVLFVIATQDAHDSIARYLHAIRNR